MSTVVELFTTPNKKTRSGEPQRWRWRVMEKNGPVVDRSKHSFRSEVKALLNAERDATVNYDAVLRRPGHPDTQWVH